MRAGGAGVDGWVWLAALSASLGAGVVGCEDKPKSSLISTELPKGGATAEDPDVPPPDVAHNPAKAKEYIQDQNCKTSCVQVHKVCLGTADGDDAKARCDDELSRCESACP